MKTMLNINLENIKDIDAEITRLQSLRNAVRVCAMGDKPEEVFEVCKISNICTFSEFKSLVKETIKNNQ